MRLVYLGVEGVGSRLRATLLCWKDDRGNLSDNRTKPMTSKALSCMVCFLVAAEEPAYAERDLALEQCPRLRKLLGATPFIALIV